MKEREKLCSFLKNKSFVKKVWASDANFLLCWVDNPKQVMSVCLQNGVVVRDRSSDYGLEGCIRFSIGSSAENKRLMEVLDYE